MTKYYTMDKITAKAQEYDEGVRRMYDYYKKEYERTKNKMDDNHPFLLNLKRKIKELRKELNNCK